MSNKRQRQLLAPVASPKLFGLSEAETPASQSNSIPKNECITRPPGHSNRAKPLSRSTAMAQTLLRPKRRAWAHASTSTTTFKYHTSELDDYALPVTFRPGRSFKHSDGKKSELNPAPPSPRPAYGGHSRRQIATTSKTNEHKTVKNLGGEDWQKAKNILGSLVTSEDAIAFFAQQKNSTPVKFLFLNRANNGKNFRPYDLEVVDRAKASSSEHFIMSAEGISRVVKGQATEVVPLITWMREATIFNVLRSTKCFKYYLVNKMFRRWLEGVRFNSYCEKRKRIESNLFCAKPAFCPPLMRLRAQLAGIYKVRVQECLTQKAFNIFAFVEKQEKIIKDAVVQFENMMDELQLLTEKTCEVVVKRARHFLHLMEREEDFDARERNRNKSLVVLKQERAERMKMCALTERDAKSLGDFIRFIDYMITESFVEVSVSAQAELLEQMMMERKTGMFESAISFAEGGVTNFSPSLNEIQMVLESRITKLIDAVQHVPRILFARPLKPFLTRVYVGHQPNKLILEDKTFKSLNMSINRKLSLDFLEAKNYVKQFEFTRDVWEFNLELYTQKWNDLSTKEKVAETRKSINICNGWHRDIGRVRAGGAVGCLFVESRKLKKSLLPIADEFLNYLKVSLTVLASQKCQTVLEKIKTRVKRLENIPNSLDEFSVYVADFKKSNTEKGEILQEAQLTEDLYRMLQLQRVRVPPDNSVQLDEMRALLQRDGELLEDANVLVYETMPQMMTTLDMNIATLNRDAETIQGELVMGDFEDSSLSPEYVLPLLREVQNRLLRLEKLSRDYTIYQESFGKPPYTYKILKESRSMFDVRFAVWDGLRIWNENLYRWQSVAFRSIVVSELVHEVTDMFKNASLYHKRIKNSVTEQLKDKIYEFKMNLGCITDLGNPAMKERHWERVFKILGKRYMSGQSFTLARLVELNVYQHHADIAEVSASASGETQIEQSVSVIAEGWVEMQLNIRAYKDSKSVFVLGPLDEVMLLMEDNQVSLQTMMGSKFIMGVRETVEEWTKNLSILSDTLDEWLICQKTWMYLETIFSAEDIQEQLPSESKLFKEVDKTWNDIMKATNENPLIMSIIEHENPSEYLSQFKKCNQILDDVQRSLENYLEVKRGSFPRFYFLSNDELLEILSQTRDPHAVQPHLSKCFDAMRSLTFGDKRDANLMLAMNSPEGEQVHFSTPVEAQGAVESWLSNVENSMKDSLRDLARHSYKAYPEEIAIHRQDWLFAYPGQTVLMIDQLFWTKVVESAVKYTNHDSSALSKCLDFIVQQIDSMVDLVRGELTKLQRGTLGATITLDVHGRDVVRLLVRKKVESIDDFEWTRQLRYYWDSEIQDCNLRQTNTNFLYAYEYLGNSFRLVVTPLTDLCYMTLTGALHLRFGGAPAGPAGTGKTETTKDLGKALARQVVVFNCSDGLDYKIMGRFFSGLAQAGAWACFDEFNRIDVEVLSVIAQQIQTIQQAIAGDVEKFMFEGLMIPLNTNFGVFITMNPGYAGRTELPDNLKALFRPVAMMVPDYRMIAEIVLFSEGFANALPLSNKMSQLYQLSSEQLSKQDHYDFGMRAVKSVLVAAGQLKRKEPETNEDLLLIRAMRDSNVPKFLEHDLPLFRGILTDLFPGLDVPFVDYGKLQEAIENQLSILNLQPVPSFVAKIIQVHETQLVRHGMMVVGEPGSGKSTNVKVLSNALKQLESDGVRDKDGFFKTVHTDRLNPKSITAGQLYGQFNLMTGEWFDGLVPSLVRTAKADKKDRRHWILFDGPVDAVWIENMNTVLDDNKTLCLANSERIKMPDGLHMMFEVQDLSVASPATVSRCGMVFMEQIHVGVIALVETWCQTVVKVTLPNHVDYLRNMIMKYTPLTIDFVEDKCSEKVKMSKCHRMSSLLKLLTSLLSEERGVSETRNDIYNILNNNYSFALVWAIGGNVLDSSRDAFSDFLWNHLSSVLGQKIPAMSVYDFVVDNDKASKVSWTTLVSVFQYNPKMSYFDMIVPTEDTAKYTFLLEAIILKGFNVLFLGETGIGKSVITQSFLDNDAHGDIFVSTTISYSAQTTPENVREIFETRLEKKRKNLIGPPAGKRMVFFVDDLNMPTLEEYGAQPPNELLRQVIDDQGYYDVDKVGLFKFLSDTSFVAACAPPGGGRSDVTPRLTRHFHQIWLTDLSIKSMKHIFGTILSGFFSFEIPSLSAISDKFVSASVDIYQSVQKGLLPTPSKSHYTYNLRDLSQVFQGLLMVNSTLTMQEEDFINLWLHEVARVFSDRLVDVTDRSWLTNACKNLLMIYFNIEREVETFENLMFGDYLDPDRKDYCQLRDKAAFLSVLNEQLEEFNITSSKTMNLVFFDDAMSHISRLSRVLRQPRGNALLVGVGGSGRKSLTRLAAFMASFKCNSIEITKTYDRIAWFEDLKPVLMEAGCNNNPAVFLFSDTQIVQESFLEDINQLLNAGDIPNFYAPEEIEEIIRRVRPLSKAAGKSERKNDVYAYYVSLVRQNLRIVLAFSPIGDSFRNRCRMFPSLVNCCAVDWFDPWPEDALFSVASRFLGGEESHALEIERYVGPLCTVAVKIHRSVEVSTFKYYKEVGRHNYTTPTSYLELIQLFKGMLLEERGKAQANLLRYENGLKKLKETEDLVEGLKVELTEMQPVLAQAKIDTEELMTKLTKDQADAAEARGHAEKDQNAAAKVAAEVNVIKSDCEADLAEAMPAYFSAVEALDSLDKKSIVELKSFASPPEMVEFTLNAVCVMMGVKPNWKEGKKLMGDMNFIDRLKKFDKDNIPKSKIKKLKPFIKNKEFTPAKVEKVSVAAKSLCMWVHAMHTYDRVAKTIAPKKKKLAEAESQLELVNLQLQEKQEMLQEIEKRVADLQAMFEASVQKKEALEEKTRLTLIQMDRAKKLMSGLGGEKLRWLDTVDSLKLDIKNLVGNIAIAAGAVAYLGPFTAPFRHSMISEWVETTRSSSIPVDVTFDLQRILADPVEVREWTLQSLPADDFSIENGIFSTRGRRWPLMIDPQGQANRWIKNLFKENNLQVIKLTDSSFLRTLENAIRYGAPVLLENINEAIDPVLEPILLKQVFKRGGQFFLTLGDSEVPYSEDFKFFITTKLPNPHYLPEVCIKVTIVNFTVTLKGLEEQLLVDVVVHERPDLERKKDQLVLSIAADKKELKDIEDKILYMLANASGNILDDEDLINSLEASKVTSFAIEERMVEAEATTKEIFTAREGYRLVATRASVLYFVIASLSNIDPMYQYSLQYFQALYRMRLEKSENSEDLGTRLATLLDDITLSFFVNICRGLFESHKLLFAFRISIDILKERGDVTHAEWQSLLVEPPVIEVSENLPKDSPLYLSSFPFKIFQDLISLEASFPAFEGLVESCHGLDKVLWAQFITSKNIGTDDPPAKWGKTLTNIQQLILLRVIRPDQLVFGIKKFIGNTLGPIFQSPPGFDLPGCFNDSTSKIPLIFVLSEGADPMDYLLSLALENEKKASMRIVSLGQGQGPIAERHMDSARLNGDWVCLQNCHLAVSWLGDLERILEDIADKPVHDEYRLWLTSMPSKAFPVSILQMGIKITNEPPQGVKANITRTFVDMTEDEYGSCSKVVTWRKLLYGLAFFNASILERRKFGAIGWNIPYGWMNSDLKTAIMQLRLYLEEQESTPFETLNVMVGDVTYGGRITDKQDKVTNKCILSNFFSAEAMIDGYSLSESNLYCMPPGNASLSDIRKLIEELPEVEDPEVFGMHGNASITYQQKLTNTFINTIISMESGGGGGGEEDASENEKQVMDASRVMLEKLPANPFNIKDAHPMTFSVAPNGGINSIGVFCKQECDQFAKLIDVIRRELYDLQRALEGFIVMGPALEGVYHAFLYQRVPVSWENAGYPCLKPLRSWTHDFFARIKFLDDWVSTGPPLSYWLSGLFFPQGFLTSVLQVYSRDRAVAIDLLQFETETVPLYEQEVKVLPEYGSYVHGLFMQGARFDIGKLGIVEATPGELFSPMPLIWLQPTKKSELIEGNDEGKYNCPLYKTSIRAGTLSTTGHSTNFVVAMKIQSGDRSPVHWIRRGVAMLCMLDD